MDEVMVCPRCGSNKLESLTKLGDQDVWRVSCRSCRFLFSSKDGREEVEMDEMIVDANLDEKEADRQLCKFIGAKITEALEVGESDPNGTVLLADMTIYVTGNYQWEKSLDGKTKQKQVNITIY